MIQRGRVTLKVGVWIGCLSPLVALLYRYWTNDLTANPVSLVTNTLGDWTLRLLLTSLALTPLRIVFGIGWQMSLRRLLGLFAFFYASLHFAVWLVIDQFFDWPAMIADALKRPYVTVGMSALALLLPLALTSTAGMVKRLGARAWRRLHRLVYGVAVLGVVHFIWLAKAGRATPYYYAAILGCLLGIRAVDTIRRLVRRRISSPAHARGDGGVRTSMREWKRGLVGRAGPVLPGAGGARGMTAEGDRPAEMAQGSRMARGKAIPTDTEDMREEGVMRDQGMGEIINERAAAGSPR
jgi:methionine sulfoxide reductase heme-binding subunit